MIFVYRMNPQWLTTLMSNMKSQMQGRLKSQLESRGLRLRPADLAAALEGLSPKASHAALSYAADLLRPFAAGMGLRISRLSDLQIEVILPARTRNMDDQKKIHEAAILAAAIEATRTLWNRHAPLGDFSLSVARAELEVLKPVRSDLRLRLEISESLRESTLAEMRRHRKSTSDVLVQAFDEKDSLMAEINLHLEMKHIPSLASKKS